MISVSVWLYYPELKETQINQTCKIITFTSTHVVSHSFILQVKYPQNNNKLNNTTTKKLFMRWCPNLDSVFTFSFNSTFDLAKGRLKPILYHFWHLINSITTMCFKREIHPFKRFPWGNGNFLLWYSTTINRGNTLCNNSWQRLITQKPKVTNTKTSI